MERTSSQVSRVGIVTRPTTTPDPLGHHRVAVTPGAATSVHVAGPRSGTAASRIPGSSTPLSAPLRAPALPAEPGELALGGALEAVAGIERGDLGGVVVVDVDVDVGVGADVVVAAAAVVVVDAARGAGGTDVGGVDDRAPTVKRSTRRSSGLDHIRTWPPATEWGLLAMRLRR